MSVVAVRMICMPLPDRQTVLEAIRRAADALGRAPSRAEFRSRSGMTEYQVLQHFPSWREAVRKAGLAPDATNIKIADAELLNDWGLFVRKNREIPTRDKYRREGTYSPGVFERHFGPWSAIPQAFREFAQDRAQWTDVLTLLPVASVQPSPPSKVVVARGAPSATVLRPRHVKLEQRPTYGDPIDFRGLRHQPVNEQGVVFLFGMVAAELGYFVEAVQSGFPDCEAKRQVEAGKWQRVRIEFEFESRNFRDHGHPVDGCDVIICWRHNWDDCPQQLEVVELSNVIKSLSKSVE